MRDNHNSGAYNKGEYNSGDWNKGQRNTGSHNDGNYNSGVFNFGLYNSGDFNCGDCNSGDKNFGDYNSGSRNIGDWNSGEWNATNYSSGCFNSKEQKIYMFNKPSSWTMGEWLMSDARHILETMPEGDERQYWWDRLSKEERETIRSIPNFTADIFRLITGIDVTKMKDEVKQMEYTDSVAKKMESTIQVLKDIKDNAQGQIDTNAKEALTLAMWGLKELKCLYDMGISTESLKKEDFRKKVFSIVDYNDFKKMYEENEKFKEENQKMRQNLYEVNEKIHHLRNKLEEMYEDCDVAYRRFSWASKDGSENNAYNAFTSIPDGSDDVDLTPYFN